MDMETERDYIDLDNAMRVSGLAEKTLSEKASNGTIRSMKVNRKNNNGFKYLYHIDDCRKLAWPGTGDIARAAGVNNKTLSAYVTKFKIPMAVKVGRLWRFPPPVAEMMVRWAKNGYPVPFSGITKKY